MVAMVMMMMMMMISALSCDGDAYDDDYDEVCSITLMMVTMMVVLDEVWHAPHVVVVWHHCLASCRACSGGHPGCRIQVDRLQYAEHLPCPNAGLARCAVALAHIRAEPVWLRKEARLTKPILCPPWAGWQNCTGADGEIQCAMIWA